MMSVHMGDYAHFKYLAVTHSSSSFTFTIVIIPLTYLLENVEHCGDEPEQAVTMATHE